MSTIWRESGVQKAVKYNLRGSSLRKASPAHSYDEEERSESKQDKTNTANTADSASVFLIIFLDQSKSMVSLVRAEKMVLSGLVCARKIKHIGFDESLMIQTACMPFYV